MPPYGSPYIIFVLFCQTDSAATEQTAQLLRKKKLPLLRDLKNKNNIVQPIAEQIKAKTSQKVYKPYAKPFAEIITNFMRNHIPIIPKWMDDSVGVIQLDICFPDFWRR